MISEPVGNNRPRLIITIGRPNGALTCIQVNGKLADSLRGNRLHSITKLWRPIRTVTQSQVVDESASQLGTEKSSLVEKFTRQAHNYRNMGQPTSSAIIVFYKYSFVASRCNSIMSMSVSSISSTLVAERATTTASSGFTSHHHRVQQSIQQLISIAVSSGSTVTSTTSSSSMPSKGMNDLTTTSNPRYKFALLQRIIIIHHSSNTSIRKHHLLQEQYQRLLQQNDTGHAAISVNGKRSVFAFHNITAGRGEYIAVY